MRFRTRVIVFGYPLVEVLAFWVVGEAIGWGWAALILLAGIPVGWAVMRRAITDAREGKADDALGIGVAGVLILIPGFVTDILGAVLLLPPVRRSLAARLRTWVDLSPVRMGFVAGDVVRGEVLRPGIDQADRGS